MILGVNIDHIATVREARKTYEPDPVAAALLAILGGADGITCHLREDRRHVKDRDLNLLRDVVHSELNLEMAATPEMLRIARKVKPDMVTLVPERRQELTTEGGLDLKEQGVRIRQAVSKLKGTGILVSLFISPTPDDIHRAVDTGTDSVEIHTGPYADSRGIHQERELGRVAVAVEEALKAGVAVNAGHGLNYHNVGRIVQIPGIRGLYIGHSIVSRAVLVGMTQAVREMRTRLTGGI